MDRGEVANWIENEVQARGYWAWLDLRRSKDGHWILSPLEWVEKDAFKQAIHTLSFEDIKAHWPHGTPIEFSEVIELTKNTPLLLNVIEKDVFWHTEFVKLIPESKHNQIVIRSPMKTFGKKVRELRPEFLFATDLSTLSQYLMFEGLYLESVGGIWADVFLAPPTYRGRQIFNERMVKELKRRHLPVVIDFESLEELDSLPEDFLIQGLATQSPALLKKASSKLLESSSTNP